MQIKILSGRDVERLVNFYQANRQHLQAWEPQRTEDFYTLDYWQEAVHRRQEEMNAGRAVFFIALNSADEMIASCNLTNIVRGGFQAAYMGYAVDKEHEGKGLMKRLCEHVVNYGFAELQLNRIMANYLPHNLRSEKLLQSLGFEREGYARFYLEINGEWQDHVLTARLNPAHLIDNLK